MRDKQYLIESLKLGGATAAITAAGVALLFWATNPDPKGKKYTRRDVKVAPEDLDICLLTGKRWFNCSCCAHHILGIVFFTEKLGPQDPEDPDSYITICEACWAKGYNPETINVLDNLKLQQKVAKQHQSKSEFEAVDVDELTEAVLNDEMENQKRYMVELKREREKLGATDPKKRVYKSSTVIQRLDLIQDLLQTMKATFPDIPSYNFEFLRGRANVEVYEHSSQALHMLINENAGDVSLSEYSTMSMNALIQAQFFEHLINETIAETLCTELSSPQLWKTHTDPQIGIRFRYPASWTLSYDFTQRLERIMFIVPAIGRTTRLPDFEIEQLGYGILQDKRVFLLSFLETATCIPLQAIRVLEESTLTSHVSSGNDELPCEILFMEFLSESRNSVLSRGLHGYATLAIHNNRIYLFSHIEHITGAKAIFDKATIMEFVRSIEFLYPTAKHHSVKIKHLASGLAVKVPESPFCMKYIINHKQPEDPSILFSGSAYKDAAPQFELQASIHCQEVKDFNGLSQELVTPSLASPIRISQQNAKSALTGLPYSFADLNMRNNLIIKAGVEKGDKKYLLTFQNDVEMDPRVEKLVMESLKSISFEPVPTFYESIFQPKMRKNQQVAAIYENTKHHISIDCTNVTHRYTPSDVVRVPPLGVSNEYLVTLYTQNNLSISVCYMPIDEPIRSTQQLFEVSFFRTVENIKHEYSFDFYDKTNDWENFKVVPVKTSCSNIVVPGIELQYTITSMRDNSANYTLQWTFVRPEPYSDKSVMICVSTFYAVADPQTKMTYEQFLELAMLYHSSFTLLTPCESFKYYQQQLQQIIKTDNKDFSDAVVITSE